MMHVYRPYLIPLFKESQFTRSCTLHNPADEEAVIRRMNPGDFPGWNVLKTLVREEYGLPFVVESPGRIRRVEEQPGFSPNVHGYESRHLHIKTDGDSWFVIEHPQGLAQFDRAGTVEETVILARPSLFMEWSLLGAETPQGRLQGSESAAQGDQQALVSHLAEIIRSHQPSDWHLEPRADYCLSRLRIDGRLCLQEQLTRDRWRWLIHSVARGSNMGDGPFRNESSGKMEFVLEDGTLVSLRISIVPSLHGESLAIRFLYPAEPVKHRLEDLGFSSEQQLLMKSQYARPDGLWILAGPTGSGKSTTLHALIQRSVQCSEKILTAEDPVERTVSGVQQVNIGSPPGMTYAAAMKAFLRQSPDTILIGEIRDRETAALAIQAARTGHRVLSSLHARSPGGIVRRFEDLNQDAVDLDAVARVVILQKLVPLLCQDCRIAHLWPGHAVRLLQPVTNCMPRWYYSPHSGCPSCRFGYRGRTAVAWCATWPPPMPARDPLFDSAWSLFYHGKISPETLLPFLPVSIQPLLRFSKRKDSVKT